MKFEIFKTLPAALTSAIFLGVVSCATTPTTVDTGAIEARTFSFVARKPGVKVPSFLDNREETHGMIQDAITRNLAGKGLSRVASGGDITVAYLVIVGNNAATMEINDYFGYREGAFALQEKAHEHFTGGSQPDYFEAGTLLIDLVDPSTGKLLKRNFATQAVLRDLPADARKARVQGTVDRVLAGVRVAR